MTAPSEDGPIPMNIGSRNWTLGVITKKRHEVRSENKAGEEDLGEAGVEEWGSL